MGCLGIERASLDPGPVYAMIVVFRIEEELLYKIQNHRQRDAPHSYFYIPTYYLYFLLKEDYYV